MRTEANDLDFRMLLADLRQLLDEGPTDAVRLMRIDALVRYEQGRYDEPPAGKRPGLGAWRRRLRNVLVVLGLVLIGLGTGAAKGCDAQGSPASGGGSLAKACDTSPRPPVFTRTGRRVTITASTRSVCDAPPESHHVKVWLDYNLGQGWFQGYIPGQPHESTCVKIPTHAGTTCSFTFRGCRQGQWRTRVLVTGTGPDGRDFSFSPPEKPAITVKSCP